MNGLKLDFLTTTVLLVSLAGSISTSSGLWGHHTSPCIYEDHLVTDKNWFGYLANITIMTTGRLTFEFHYPADKCCQNILFYSEDQIAIINARMNCWQKEYLLRPEEDQILRLTPRFSWSGCHMTHPNDVATYVCKGGRSFTVDQTSERPISWYIAASNCATLQGLDLRYRMEVFGHIGDCRSGTYAGGSAVMDHVSSSAPHLSGGGGPPGGSSSAKAAFVAREPDDIAAVMATEDMQTCVIEGDINTTQVWFGFLSNISLIAGGGFFFRLSYPYSMQVQNLILYTEDDVSKLTPDKTCWQKDGVIRSSQVPDQVLDLNYRASWNGCVSKNYSHGRNLTCQGERRYEQPRKLHLAVSNCRSTVGLQMHYRFEVFGYDNDICAGVKHNTMTYRFFGLICCDAHLTRTAVLAVTIVAWLWSA